MNDNDKCKEYTVKAGRRLRTGFTTGSCAAAAAKAAAVMLLSGRPVPHVRLRTPKGMELVLEVEDIRFHGDDSAENMNAENSPEEESGQEVRENPEDAQQRDGCGKFEKVQRRALCEKPEPVYQSVSCAVRKDSGDDPDVTNGALVYAEVAFSPVPGIRIEGGEGVGRVTKPGLDQPIGAAAINSTPRRMVAEAVEEAARETENIRTVPAAGFTVTISVPKGKELAERTFNPKLGIVGGISILGTTGIVEPMSEEALLETIRTEIRVRRCEGMQILPAAPGNYGKSFFQENYGFSLDTAVTASNFIRDAVEMAAAAGFSKMLFVGHIGKLVKVAGGFPNTHSKYGDRRMEILAKMAGKCLSEDHPAGDFSFSEIKAALAGCVSTDEAVRVLKAFGLAEPVLARMTRRAREVMEGWARGKMRIEVIVFSNVHGELGKTEGAEEFLQTLRGR